MQLVERHVIGGTPQIVELCKISARLYNRCNYLLRQIYFSNRGVENRTPFPGYGELIRRLKPEACYKQLHNTKTANQTIRRCLADWSNYWKTLRAYKRDAQGFKRCPKPPGFKDGLAQVIFYKETLRQKPLKNGTIIPTNDCFIVRSKHKPQQVVITPKRFGFIVELHYKKEVAPPEKKRGRPKKGSKHFCAIDLGVNNLATITSDQHAPILINGRIVKSINREYNKSRSKRASRKCYWRLENYFHHTANHIVQSCLQHGITTIIIGRNKGWKQRVKPGKVNGQNFQSVPFYKLIQKITYKAELAGIQIVFVDEAYTSKASYLDKDEVPSFQKDAIPPQFSGKRVHRGLYQASNGQLINADVNASANIARKVIGDADLLSRLDRSVAETPVRVNPLKPGRGRACPNHQRLVG